jgi:nucleotide-binding universal stress UspA family protein
MFRDLLVHVDGGKAGRRRVQFAVDLAIRLGARLSGLHVTPPPEVSPRFKPSRVDKVSAELSTKLASDAKTAAVIFKEETERRLADASWFAVAGDVAQGINERARYADLIILGQYEWEGPPEIHPLPVAHSVVLRCGRPVLVVPAVVPSITLEKIAIAWDGSREAVRAVHDALPLLRLSQSVQIMTMIHLSAGDSEADTKNLSAHLANHGVGVQTNVIQVRTIEEHASLQRRMEQGQYGLVVLGGYSHPMWIEFIFSGATTSILMSSRTPMLISH